jgi:predicted DNA-binding transcriptional regulator AlpA
MTAPYQETAMMGPNESIFYTKKEVCQVIRLSPAQLDRLRADGKFPDPVSPTGAPNGKLLWLKVEVGDWCLTRPRRKLKPPRDESLTDDPPGNRPGLH